MKISYQREMKHNYLIIDPEEAVSYGYECQMMERNMIEGLLRLRLGQENGDIRYYYEITSRQPLGRLLENRQLSGEELRSLLGGISDVLGRIEEYLLKEADILLEPEAIYVDPDTFRVWLCMVPGLNRDFPEAYGKLLEYFLGKVDHQDKECVVLAYGLYQESRKENYGMEDILKLLYRRQEEEKELPVQPLISPETVPQEKRMWERIKDALKGRSKEKKAESPVQLPWQEMFVEEPDYPAAPAMPTADFTPIGQDTVLLSDHSSEHRIRKLRALETGEGDIPLSYYPFIIGKQENMVDYFLQKESVSRLHLRIDRIGEEYRIMDLNSTNGTMVQGRLLENNESAVLRLGDEVKIAQYRYHFE